MIHGHLDFVLEAAEGKLLSRHQEIFEGIGTDTRKPLLHKLFIALKGASFDAHHFLSQAVEQGAAVLVLHDESYVDPSLLSRVTVIKVKDTLLALQNLAKAYRRQSSAKIIGIAGSNGKTTSKEFCSAVLGSSQSVHCSQGSFNNHWGVPLTLLTMPESAESVVVEMGMNHSGELALLTEIAEPDICVCTCVGIEHIEHFGTLEKIAEAEEEIYTHSPEKTLRIYNMDNVYTSEMLSRHKKQFLSGTFLTFSSDETKPHTDVHLRVSEMSMEFLNVYGHIGSFQGEAKIPIFGQHNLTNLMAAACVGLAVGLTPFQIWSALPLCRTTWGRNQLVITETGAQVLFDGYNSNPDSMKALVENIPLLFSSGRRIGIFAEMLELGALSSTLHRSTGELVGTSCLDEIWFFGPHAEDFIQGLQRAGFKGKTRSSINYDPQISREIAQSLKKDDLVLVKGSRGMSLERFVKMTRPLDFHLKS